MSISNPTVITGAIIKALYEAEANAFTDTKNTKLAGIEAEAKKYPDTGEQAFLDADHTKLNGIEAEAKKYPDTGEQAFLDADHTKLDGVAVGATKIAQGDSLSYLFAKDVSATVRHGKENGSDELNVTAATDVFEEAAKFTFTNGIKGTVLLNMELKSDHLSYKCIGRWRHGATPIGTEQSGDILDTYDAKPEIVIVDVAAGETLECWVARKNDGYPENYIKNMNISYDNKDIVKVAVV